MKQLAVFESMQDLRKRCCRQGMNSQMNSEDIVNVLRLFYVLGCKKQTGLMLQGVAPSTHLSYTAD